MKDEIEAPKQSNEEIPPFPELVWISKEEAKKYWPDNILTEDAFLRRGGVWAVKLPL